MADEETPPAPDEREKEIDRLNDEITDLRSKLADADKETRSWMEKQLQTATARLDNLEANSKTGLENLSGQLSELRELLTQRLHEQQREEPDLDLEAPDPPLVETPPDPVPSDQLEISSQNGGAGDPGSTPLVNPSPQITRQKRRVV